MLSAKVKLKRKEKIFSYGVDVVWGGVVTRHTLIFDIQKNNKKIQVETKLNITLYIISNILCGLMLPNINQE